MFGIIVGIIIGILLYRRNFRLEAPSGVRAYVDGEAVDSYVKEE